MHDIYVIYVIISLGVSYQVAIEFDCESAENVQMSAVLRV